MSRPRKCRRVCALWEAAEGLCGRETPTENCVLMTVDEYETIRLIDYDGQSQEQCALQMQVARTTVQQMYACARRKLARVLIEGCSLKVQGGDYRLCDGNNSVCSKKACLKNGGEGAIKPGKGERNMRIAVTYENGNIFQHFGHSEAFKIYDVENGKIIASRVVSTEGSGHGALAGMLANLQVDALICGGIGGGAQMALAQAGIRLYGGAHGDADKAVEALLENALDFDPDARCDHHDHHHGEHECGQHGCGEHHCGGHCGK